MTKERQDWVTVSSVRTEEEARVLSGRLRVEGIESRIYPEFQGSAYQGVEAMRRPFEIMVPLHREADARAFLEGLATS